MMRYIFHCVLCIIFTTEDLSPLTESNDTSGQEYSENEKRQRRQIDGSMVCVEGYNVLLGLAQAHGV